LLGASLGIEAPAGRGLVRTELATVVRGVLAMPRTPIRAGYSPVLFDAGGRIVMELAPGANDVSRLAPGVYFVRTGEDDADATGKVVITR
jgi:hypothetical protein